MKTFLFDGHSTASRFAVLCCLLLPTLWSCEKSDSGESSELQLSEVIPGHYWEEEVHFVSLYEGQDIISTGGITDYFEFYGGDPCVPEVLLGTLYVEPNTSVLRHYLPDGYKYTYTTKEYTIQFNSESGTFRVVSALENLIERNAVEGYEIKPLSVTPEEIVFEVPIKLFIREKWGFDYSWEDYSGSFPFFDSHSLHVVWRRVDEPDYWLQQAVPVD